MPRHRRSRRPHPDLTRIPLSWILAASATFALIAVGYLLSDRSVDRDARNTRQLAVALADAQRAYHQRYDVYTDRILDLRPLMRPADYRELRDHHDFELEADSHGAAFEVHVIAATEDAVFSVVQDERGVRYRCDRGSGCQDGRWKPPAGQPQPMV